MTKDMNIIYWVMAGLAAIVLSFSACSDAHASGSEWKCTQSGAGKMPVCTKK